MGNELRDKIYDMSNHFLPLDMFYNDIENMAKYPSFNQASAFKDLEKIADFVLDLQSQLVEKEKLEYTDTIKFVETSEQNVVATELDRLNKQLAEKDKEIARLKNRPWSTLVPTRQNGKAKLIEIKLSELQNQKAIEMLEKVKAQCEFDISFACDEQEQRLYDFIDQQIELLKQH